MVTEAFAIVRSGEKIAYLDVHRGATDGINLMYNDEFITYRHLNDVNIKDLIDDCNLRYKSLKLIVNKNVSGSINSNIKEELMDKEINVIVEEDKIIFENDEIKINSNKEWFREIYFYFLNDYAIQNYKQWETERIYRYGYY